MIHHNHYSPLLTMVLVSSRSATGHPVVFQAQAAAPQRDPPVLGVEDRAAAAASLQSLRLLDMEVGR